jgi:hypothetical protein
MQNDKLKSALQEIINYLQYIGNEDVNVSRTDMCNYIYNTAISALTESDQLLKVYAIVLEDPEAYVREDDDIRREVFGIFDTRQEAEEVLRGIRFDNPFGHFYSIEEWIDEVPF